LYKFIFNFLLKSALEELDIGVFVEIKVGDDLLELGGVYASRSSLSKLVESLFCGPRGIDITKGLFKLLFEYCIRSEDSLSSIALVLLRFIVKLSNI
jgi:hypothetical protein